MNHYRAIQKIAQSKLDSYMIVLTPQPIVLTNSNLSDILLKFLQSEAKFFILSELRAGRLLSFPPIIR